jgi:hypothetical protein
MMKVSVGDLRRIIHEILEEDIEEQIETLQGEPEFKNLEMFTNFKLDNDEFEYNFVELQALSRNMDQKGMSRVKVHVSAASQTTVDKIRNELEGLGFKFVGRKPLKNIRGVTSGIHGTSPFVGMYGGSGMGINASGPVGFGMGGGPGAMGSGKKWDAAAPGNLSMGARRR